jgi:hypothetical protein
MSLHTIANTIQSDETVNGKLLLTSSSIQLGLNLGVSTNTAARVKAAFIQKLDEFHSSGLILTEYHDLLILCARVVQYDAVPAEFSPGKTKLLADSADFCSSELA